VAEKLHEPALLLLFLLPRCYIIINNNVKMDAGTALFLAANRAGTALCRDA
jgi:hypothetical protein